MRPRLVKATATRPSLGDMLQHLALISPADLSAITKLTRDVHKRALLEHARRFPADRKLRRLMLGVIAILGA